MTIYLALCASFTAGFLMRGMFGEPQRRSTDYEREYGEWN